MFESKVDKILGQYNFDPVQLFLVEKRGETFLRYQYFSNGEVTKDINIKKAIINNPDEILALITSGRTPLEFSIQGCSPEIHFKFRSIKEGNLYKGIMVAKIMRFIPISWNPTYVKQASLIAFFERISNLMHNKQVKIAR